jgi:branched-chain amino acid transport system substrate-binding protein
VKIHGLTGKLAIILASAIVFSSSIGRAVAADPYPIDVILPLTGSAAFVGQTTQQALKVAEAEVNRTGGIKGRPLKLNFLDDQTNPQSSVQLTNQVLAKKPAVFLGSEIVAMCNAMVPLVKDGPLMYCLSPGIHPQKGTYVFSSAVSTDDLISSLIRFSREKGWTKIAIITSTDATGQDADRAFEAALAQAENKTINVVAREHFNPSDVTLSAQFAHVEAAKPQLLIAWTTGTPFGSVLRAAKTSGAAFPIATTAGNLSWPAIAQFRSILPKELYFSGYLGAPDTGNVKLAAAVARAKSLYHQALAAAGAKADNGTDVAWDPLMLVVQALRTLGPSATAAQIRDYLSNLTSYAGTNGIYDFKRTPQRGLDASQVLISQWDEQKGAFVAASEPGGAPLRVSAMR